jgi:hypothetical protein
VSPPPPPHPDPFTLTFAPRAILSPTLHASLPSTGLWLPVRRDIYSIGLKTLITGVPLGFGDRIASVVTRNMLSGLEPGSPIASEALEILAEMLKRFGPNMESNHSALLSKFLAHVRCIGEGGREGGRSIPGAMVELPRHRSPSHRAIFVWGHAAPTCALCVVCCFCVPLCQLSASQPAVRKRATACLGNLSVHLSDANLRSLVSSLLDGIQRPAAGQDVRALIQTVGTVSRQVGFRLGRYLPDIVPQMLSSIDHEAPDADEQATNDLREICFQVRPPPPHHCL